jgi:hypothetical protein
LNQHWLIYALGGGWGHLNRALSLGRIAAKHKKITIITNSPYITYLKNEGCIIQAIPHDISFTETCQKVGEIVTNINYNCLIVDTFPRGLGGELADILPKLQHIPRILIHRDINPHYVTAKNLREFATKNFDAIIVPGEGEDLPLCDLPNAYHTAPWLIRNPWELPKRNWTQLNILKSEKHAKIILVCATGKTSEIPIFTELAIQIEQTFADCVVRILAATCPENTVKHLWVSHHPGIECIAAADIVVGGAGYNTVCECMNLGVPLIAIALPRLYDRQTKRAAKVYQVQNTHSAISTIRMLLEQLKSNQVRPAPSYQNGAIQAFDFIEKWSRENLIAK